MSYDVVIAGGGPAGLQAALVLGRSRKRVLLCDAGQPRNSSAERVQGFLTRDGTPPAEMRRIAREQLAAYDSVAIHDQAVEAIDGDKGAFQVKVGGRVVEARTILLATGLIDEIPEMYRPHWGRTVFLCPYCHAWEVRDRRFGAIVWNPSALNHALFLRGWTSDLVLFTDASFELNSADRSRIERCGLVVEEAKIRRLVGDPLTAVELEDGRRIERDILFIKPSQSQPELVRSLGLRASEDGAIDVDACDETSRAGIYAAGDLVTTAQSAMQSAASGAKAASSITFALTMAD